MRRALLLLFSILLTAFLLASCGVGGSNALPPPQEDAGSQFGVDININMDTIDDYLGREDVAYRDVRMLFDPADYGAIGGEADLSRTIQGFRVVPYPYLATLAALPVSGAYQGDTLFTVEWNDDGTIASVRENYLFPRDKAIFLMCGGGGYAGMMKALLLELGWEETLLYNIGGNWTYTGENSVELIVYPEDAEEDNIYATWRADYAYIDFSLLHPAG